MYSSYFHNVFPPHKVAAELTVAEPGHSPGTALFLLWAFLMAAGMSALALYDFKGGPSLGYPVRWPENDAIPFDAERPVLVMFLHPRCPCSVASLAQLERVLSRTHYRAYVVAVRPAGVAQHWERGANLEKARQLPDTSVIIDDGGMLARRFGAADSGTVLAFDRKGIRRFSGGITVSRGHEGDSQGSLALLDIGAGLEARVSEMPVFGCSLLGPVGSSSGGAIL